MNWDRLRGSAIKKKPDKPRNLKIINYKIIYVINLELQDVKSKVKVSNNTYGRWIMK